MADDVKSVQPEKPAEPKATAAGDYTEAMLFAELDELVARAIRLGLKDASRLLAKYTLKKGAGFLEDMIEYGFSKWKDAAR